MNKHKTYWSAMGNEVAESSARKEDFEKFTEQLEIMFGKYGTTEVLNEVRRVYEKEAD